MSDLFQSLVNLFEILAIGVFAVGVIIYILLLYHPLLYFLLKYLTSGISTVTASIDDLRTWYNLGNTTKEVKANNESAPDHPTKGNNRINLHLFGLGDFHPGTTLQFFGLLGLLYITGSAANIATYAFLKNNDKVIINWLYEAALQDANISKQVLENIIVNINNTNSKDSTKTNPGNTSDNAVSRFNTRFNERYNNGTIEVYPVQPFTVTSDNRTLTSYCLLPVLQFNPWFAPEKSEKLDQHHLEMILTQAEVRTYHQDANLELLKFMRLQRAVLLFAFVIGLFALIKLLITWRIKFLYKKSISVSATPGNKHKVMLLFLDYIDFGRYLRNRIYAIKDYLEHERQELAPGITHSMWKKLGEESDPKKASDKYIRHRLDVNIYSHVAVLFVSFIAYIISVKLWYDVSVFYHCNIIGVFMQGK